MPLSDIPSQTLFIPTKRSCTTMRLFSDATFLLPMLSPSPFLLRIQHHFFKTCTQIIGGAREFSQCNEDWAEAMRVSDSGVYWCSSRLDDLDTHFCFVMVLEQSILPKLFRTHTHPYKTQLFQPTSFDRCQCRADHRPTRCP